MKIAIYFLLFYASIFAPPKFDEGKIGLVAENLRWTVGVKPAEIEGVEKFFSNVHSPKLRQGDNQNCINKLKHILNLAQASPNDIDISQTLIDFGYLFYVFFAGCSYQFKTAGGNIDDAKIIMSIQEVGLYFDCYKNTLHPIFLFLSKQFKHFINKIYTFKPKLEGKNRIEEIAKKRYGYFVHTSRVQANLSSMCHYFFWSQDDLNNLFCSFVPGISNAVNYYVFAGANLNGYGASCFSFLFLQNELVVQSAHILASIDNAKFKSSVYPTAVSWYGGAKNNFRSSGVGFHYNFSFDWISILKPIYSTALTSYHYLILPENESESFEFLCSLINELKEIIKEDPSNTLASSLLDNILNLPSLETSSNSYVEEIKDDDLAANNMHLNDAMIAGELLRRRKEARIEAEAKFRAQLEMQVKAEQEHITQAVIENALNNMERNSAKTNTKQISLSQPSIH